MIPKFRSHSTCEQALELDGVVEEDLEELGLVGLEAVGLVNDEDLPADGAERGRVHAHHLVRGQQHVELDLAAGAELGGHLAAADRLRVERELVLAQDLPRVLWTYVRTECELV